MYLSSLPQLLIIGQHIARQVQEYMSNNTLGSLARGFYNKDISIKIKAKFGSDIYLWQISVITNIAHYKKNIFVIAGTNTRESLTYQFFFKTNRSIILVISLTIILMKD